MAKQDKIFVHFSTIIAQARLRLGFATLRELYREKNPSIDYATWLHAESGRRIPSSSIVKTMADILEIDKEELLIAYCKDKFDDPEYHQILDSFGHNRFTDVDALLEARDHERSGEFVFTEEQIKAFQQDVRLRLFLIYTYDRELKTSLDRLASFFSMDKSEVKKVVDHLQSLRLVEVIDETIKRIYIHTNLPKNVDIFDFRRELLLKGLEVGLKKNSHITNYYVNITEKSYKKLLGFFDFIEANLTKMDKEDSNKMNSQRFQITLISNRLPEGSDNDRSKQCETRQS